MAAVTGFVERWNTTAGTKSTASLAPTVDDLIVVIHGMSGWASGDTSVITDDQGGVYTQIGADPLSTGGGTGGALWISIRTTLFPATVQTIFTATNVGDTGGGLTVLFVSGMSRTGANAALQNKGESTQTESPVVITFGAATQASSVIILGCLGEDNPSNLGPPTGFLELTDTGWNTPTTGIHVCSVNSGKTLSAYTYAGGSFIDHNEVGVELDTSVPPAGWGPLLALRGNRLVMAVN